jgi:hypothetical protein
MPNRQKQYINMKTAPLNTRMFAVLYEVMYPEDAFLNLFEDAF